MSSSITDAWGRKVSSQTSLDGHEIAYTVTGPGQNFTQTFSASTPQAVAIAAIESAMPSALATPPLPIIPQTVSRFQAMAIMSLTASKTNAGKTLLDDVQVAVTAAGGLVLLAWQNASEFDRKGLFIAELSVGLGLTSADLDAMFVAASQIAG